MPRRPYMLLQFTVENFRSIREAQTLSMVATKQTDHPDLVREIPAHKLRVNLIAGLYGPNASGKSNVLKALNFAVRTVQFSHSEMTAPVSAELIRFRLDARSSQRPAAFELDLLHEGVRYTYGFEMSPGAVHREWLYASPGARPRLWFSRDASAAEQWTFGRHLKGDKAVISRLTRPGSLFLSAAAQNNHPQLWPLWMALSSTTIVDSVSHGQVNPWASLMMYDVSNEQGLAGLVRAADLGVQRIEWREAAGGDRLKPVSELRGQTAQMFNALPLSPLEDQGQEAFSERDFQAMSKEPVFVHRQEGGEGGEVRFEWADESLGTRAFFNTLPALDAALTTGGLLAMDEIEAHLHPSLLLMILAWFRSPQYNPLGAQLIFTSHQTRLLRQLRRDAVWLTEKDPEGATHLYSLAEFKPRKDEDIEAGYLQGRYGAIPFLDELLEVDLSAGKKR